MYSKNTQTEKNKFEISTEDIEKLQHCVHSMFGLVVGMGSMIQHGQNIIDQGTKFIEEIDNILNNVQNQKISKEKEIS